MTTLERIKAEIEQMETLITKFEALQIIDKYASEDCDNDCEHCAYLECPKEPCEDAVSRQAVTNGEVVKKTFPHYDIEIDEHKGYVRVFYEDFYTTYPWKWWNAKYKGDMPSVQPKPIECEDAVSRQAIMKLKKHNLPQGQFVSLYDIEQLPSVQPKAKTGRCKECQYFEHDSVANVDGIPLIVAHEICSKWGDGCKTNENGYCFMFERKGGAE